MKRMLNVALVTCFFFSGQLMAQAGGDAAVPPKPAVHHGQKPPKPVVEKRKTPKQARPGNMADRRKKGRRGHRRDDDFGKIIRDANPVDRAQLMLAQSYKAAGDIDKAIATLEAESQAAIDPDFAGFTRLMLGKLYIEKKDYPKAITMLAGVTGKSQLVALKTLIRTAEEQDSYPDALAALQAAFTGSKDNLQKASLIDAVFQLAETAQRSGKVDFYRSVMVAIPKMMDRKQAEQIQAAREAYKEQKKLEREKEGRDDMAKNIADINERLARLEDFLRDRGGRGERMRPGKDDARMPMGDKNPDQMRKKMEGVLENMTRAMKQAEARGDKDAAEQYRRRIERIQGFMKRRNPDQRGGMFMKHGGKDDAMRDRRDPAERRARLQRKIRELEAEGKMDDAEALRKKLKDMDVKMDKGVNDPDAPKVREEF